MRNKVDRVVLTSSVGAVTDEPVKRYTEADWNTTSSLKRNAYYYSKTMAERAAWDFIDRHKDEENCPELVVILVSLLRWSVTRAFTDLIELAWSNRWCSYDQSWFRKPT